MDVDFNGLMRSIEQEAQIKLGERIPMSATEVQAKEIAEKLKAFMADRKLTQADVARQLDIGTAMFNQFMTGKYHAQKGLDELINKSVNYMESILRREKKVVNREYVETGVAKKIAAVISHTEALTDTEGKIGIIIGDGGHGKSLCLREYAKANKNTLYIELDDTMTSTTMFKAVADKLKIDSSGSLASIASRLVESLCNRYLVVMLDEASGLSVRMLNLLRQIIVVKARCPLILSGNQDLLKTVMQPKTKRGCESLDQFTSRMSYILNLDEDASGKGGGGLYTAEDIRKLFEYGGIRLTGDAVGTLRKICTTERTGRLRTCNNVVIALHTSAQIIKKGSMDSNDIISAINELGLPVRVWLPVRFGETNQTEETQSMAAAG